jgi:hypothetical protein
MAVMRWFPLILAVVACAFLTACQNFNLEPNPRSADEQSMFGAVSMRLHPIFTQVKNWTNSDKPEGAKPDGVEALLEFEDRFGDPTKAAGAVVFELFDYRQYYPDDRGSRVSNPWSATLFTVDEQRAHWDAVSRAYRFQLACPDLRLDKSYVLTAMFEPAVGKRFFTQMILEAQEKPGRGHAARAQTEPTGQP